MVTKPLGIYVHIPFCRSKCEYCDFYSLSGGRNKPLMDQYLYALILHIREAAALATDYVVDTVFFGGGTPSFFGADGLARIFTELDRRFHLDKNAEITVEVNPDTVTRPLLKKLRRVGFNRLSIGIQSDNDEILKALGRPHTFQQGKNAFRMAREWGFDNISVDLMYGLPNQNRAQWGETLQNVLKLKPNHISCYGLKVEEGTPLATYAHCANLPDDDAQADMYLYAVETLQALGYHQYEISNFSKAKYPCRHNLKYWTGQEYLSFGPTAASDFAGKRFTFIADVQGYIDGVINGEAILAQCQEILPQERAGEFIMLGLRTVLGISPKEYEEKFLLSFQPMQTILEGYLTQNMAVFEDETWRLTPKGFLLSNQILSDLLMAQEGDG